VKLCVTNKITQRTTEKPQRTTEPPKILFFLFEFFSNPELGNYPITEPVRTAFAGWILVLSFTHI